MRAKFARGLRFLKNGAAVIAAFAAMSGAASAHTVSIGFENSGPGAVNIWLGTYSTGHASIVNEGSLSLQGVNGNPYALTTVVFNLLAGPGIAFKPSGLIDGLTNFYIPDSGASPNAALVGSEAGFDAACPACGPVDRWQGVTFVGLSPGDYQFTWIPIAFPTAQWDILNRNMNGVFTLDAGVVNPSPVPLPAALPLFASGLAALGLLARRKRKARAAA
jgi:hypothetical protein